MHHDHRCNIHWLDKVINQVIKWKKWNIKCWRRYYQQANFTPRLYHDYGLKKLEGRKEWFLKFFILLFDERCLFYSQSYKGIIEILSKFTLPRLWLFWLSINPHPIIFCKHFIDEPAPRNSCAEELKQVVTEESIKDGRKDRKLNWKETCIFSLYCF